MSFFRKTPKSARYTNADIKEADVLEAYTCWLKNERLSRKQKSLLKNIQESNYFHKLKDLVDFAHYRFQETESVSPQPGAKDRVGEKLMKAIRGETAENTEQLPVTLDPQVAYSPQAMGNVDTDVFPVSQTPPEDEVLNLLQNAEDETDPDIHTLAHLNVSFEKMDDEVCITDLGSSTPAYVEGVRVRDSAPVEEGSEIKCGEITFQIVDMEKP